MSNENELDIMVIPELLDSHRKNGAFTAIFKVGPLYRWTYDNGSGSSDCEYYSCKDTAMSLHKGYAISMNLVKQS